MISERWDKDIWQMLGFVPHPNLRVLRRGQFQWGRVQVKGNKWKPSSSYEFDLEGSLKNTSDR